MTRPSRTLTSLKGRPDLHPFQPFLHAVHHEAGKLVKHLGLVYFVNFERHSAFLDRREAVVQTGHVQRLAGIADVMSHAASGAEKARYVRVVAAAEEGCVAKIICRRESSSRVFCYAAA